MKKEVEMDIQWRTVQMFLSEDGISEVEIDADNHNKVRCSCKTFQSAARCKHSKFVRDNMAADGHYSVRIPENIPDEDAFEAINDPIAWREFVIKYGEVEIL